MGRPGSQMSSTILAAPRYSRAVHTGHPIKEASRISEAFWEPKINMIANIEVYFRNFGTLGTYFRIARCGSEWGLSLSR
jgi:hypothetical protein